jgi:hypothetical protein
MRVALTIRRYLIVPTSAVLFRSAENGARESNRVRQGEHFSTVLARSRITHLVHLCRRVPWANRRLIHLTTPSFTQEA